MNKVILFLERMWLVMAVVCLAMALSKFLDPEDGDGMYFLIFGGLATLLFFLRRRTRKRMEQEEMKGK